MNPQKPWPQIGISVNEPGEVIDFVQRYTLLMLHHCSSKAGCIPVQQQGLQQGQIRGAPGLLPTHLHSAEWSESLLPLRNPDKDVSCILQVKMCAAHSLAGTPCSMSMLV